MTIMTLTMTISLATGPWTERALTKAKAIGIAIRMEVLIPAPLGNYDKSTDQPSDRRTGGAIGKLHII